MRLIKEITINRCNRNQLENETRRIPLLQSNTSRIAKINEETTKNPHYSVNPRTTLFLEMPAELEFPVASSFISLLLSNAPGSLASSDWLRSWSLLLGHFICWRRAGSVTLVAYVLCSRCRVARLALLQPKTINLALLRSSWLKFLFDYFMALLQLFVPQIFLGEELRVVRVACPATIRREVGHHTVVSALKRWQHSSIKLSCYRRHG